MALLFSTVTATRESDKESKVFLARGIPKDYEDLEIYAGMDEILDEIDEDTTITIETESFTYGEGERYDATFEELAYMQMRMLDDDMVGSVSIDDDIMNPSAWEFTPPLPYNPDWEGCGNGKSRGNIEGTLAICPDGKLYNFMRYDMLYCRPNYGKIIKYEVDTENPEKPLKFSKAVDFPGNHAKFIIKKDNESGYYYSIICRIRDEKSANNRNLLSLMKSKDCDNWELVCDLIDRSRDNPRKVGFQYVDFIFEGDDLIWLCRTADNNANSFHNSNYITFHRLSSFRNL